MDVDVPCRSGLPVPEAQPTPTYLIRKVVTRILVSIAASSSYEAVELFLPVVDYSFVQYRTKN